MARIYPFRALRYNPAIVSLQDVVTQPYDKITPAMQMAYYKRSPYNLVRIILGLPELFDGNQPGGDVYARAARDFRAWRDAGILMQEQEPCMFAYSQRFTIPYSHGKVAERRGFIALGELQDYSQGVVFRHEQTLAQPKSDRLQLLRATRAHFGQIFMLYSDPGFTAERLIFNSEAMPDIELTDESGVLHRAWKVADPSTINLVLTALADKKLIIADGHHRYEAALAYARERAPAAVSSSAVDRAGYTLPQPPYPEAAAMMTFVNMDAEGLVILPTHRVVSGLPDFAPAPFLEKAAKYFTVEKLNGSTLDDGLARLGSTSNATAFLAVMPGGHYLLTARENAVAAALADLSPRLRQLDVVQLHKLLLEQSLGIHPDAPHDQAQLSYVRDAAEAAAMAGNGKADLAFLMNPMTVQQLHDVAFAGEVVPRESTDFYPKLLSGLTMYALD